MDQLLLTQVPLNISISLFTQLYRAVKNLTLGMTAVSNEVSYAQELPAPTVTMCPVVSTPMNSFQEAGATFLSLRQMILSFSDKYAPNR